MKRIDCLAITKYKDCPVTILHFDYSFIQLFVHKGIFYYRHDFYKPEWYLRFLWRLRLRKYSYKPEELNKIKSAVLEDAFERIDTLSLNKSKNDEKKQKKDR